VTRRYAEGTSVSAERSQDEIRSLLRKHGADRFAFAEAPEGAHIQFSLRGQQYRFTVDRPTTADAPRGTQSTWRDREWRRRWRARLLWLKATLEFAADEDSDQLRTALLAYLLLKDGRTVGQLVESGGLPLLNAGNG
jgi:hypothetical protein